MYANYEYYTADYGGTAIPEGDWPTLSRQADAFLDHLTFGRLKTEAIPDHAKMAACAVVEALFMQRDEPRPGSVKSEGVDGDSVTYEGAGAARTRRMLELYDAASLWLPPFDPLRYRGV